MSDDQKVQIPERHQEFCRAVARIAREYEMQSFSGSYRPGYGDAWQGEIKFAWEQGRHGEDSDRLGITSSLYVHTKLGPQS